MSEFPVIYNKQVGPSHYLLGLKAESLIKGSPGQFLHIRVRGEETTDPLLRRPFSIYDVDQQQQIVSIVYRVVGRGTRILSEVKTGNQLGVLGPLGSGFTMDFRDKQLLIIGGGMGIAPLYYLVRQLMDDNNVRVLLGGKYRNQLDFFIREFRGLDCRLDFAIEGYQGTVVDLWQQQAAERATPDYIYSCGPTAMLRQVQALARKHDLQGEFSLEERMGCGIGVCLSCVCQTHEGNKRLCQEGPVLPLSEVIFDESAT